MRIHNIKAQNYTCINLDEIYIIHGVKCEEEIAGIDPGFSFCVTSKRGERNFFRCNKGEEAGLRKICDDLVKAWSVGYRV